MSDETFEILRTPFDPPPTREWWLSEFLSYCAADEQPTVADKGAMFHDCMVLFFPSKYACGWLWAQAHPVDAIMHAIDAGAITKTAGTFSHDYTRLLKHRERAALSDKPPLDRESFIAELSEPGRK